VEIRQDWEKKLIQEARKLTKHGWGEMGFLAYRNEKGNTRVNIKAGKGWIFDIEKKAGK